MATTVGGSFDPIGSVTTAGFTTIPSWIPSDYLWTLIYGFVIAFLLAFAVGANDVANSFGTTVGSKVLSLKAACILASIFETLGAVFVGAKVGETIRKGIIDITVYNETESGTELLMLGEVSAMTVIPLYTAGGLSDGITMESSKCRGIRDLHLILACCTILHHFIRLGKHLGYFVYSPYIRKRAAVWQLIATAFGLPVSGTHSIVGACIGFSVVAVGSNGVNWSKLGFIVASWFISPVLSGVMTISLFIFLKRVILDKDQPLKNCLRCLPLFYAFTFGVNCLSISYIGAPLLGLDTQLWVLLLANMVLMAVVAIVVQFVVVPRLRRKAIREMSMEDVKPSKIVVSRDCDPVQRIGIDNNQSTEIFCTVAHPTQNERKLDNNCLDEALNPDTSLIKDSENEEITAPDSSDSLLNKSSLDSSSYDGDLDSTLDITNSEKQQRMGKKVDDDDQEDEPDDPASVRFIFSSLQILTACFGSFAHGGNDVSNAIGPLIALWLIYHSGEVAQTAITPWYLLMYGGLGIVAGLWILGRRVIKTIGNDLTKLTPSRGFCIELMTALTVLVASNIGIPVSTTHCKVGSVVSIGWFRSRNAVTWSTVRNIAVAWFVTVPVSGLISAGVMYILLLATG